MMKDKNKKITLIKKSNGKKHELTRVNLLTP
jgi:hypothetical protein